MAVLVGAFVGCVLFSFAFTYPHYWPGYSPSLYDQRAVYAVFYYFAVFAAGLIHRKVHTFSHKNSKLMQLLWTQAALVVVSVVADKVWIAWIIYLFCSLLSE